MRIIKKSYTLGTFKAVQAFGLEFDFYDWAVVRGERVLFSFCCSACRRWHLGCSTHWFCGLCRSCEAFLEECPDDVA